MLHGIFTVRYITSKNSFCYLSEQSSKYFDDGVALKISYGNNYSAYLSPQPLPGLNENELGINRLQAQVLNLLENESVMVNVCSNIPGIRRLKLSPESKDDYEILELLAENVESTLLNQIRVINVNQKFIIWVTDSIHVTVNVDAAEPVSPGRLDNFTELEVLQPKSSVIDDAYENAKNDSKWGFNRLLNYFNKGRNTGDISEDVVQKFSKTHSTFGFILHPAEGLPDSIKNKDYFNVFAVREQLPKNLQFFSDIFNMKVIIPPVVNNSYYVEESNTTIKTITVRLCILEANSLSDQIAKYSFPILYVHNCIFKHFNIKTGSKVFLDSVKFIPNVSSIEIKTTKDNVKTAQENFKLFVADAQRNNNILLNSGFVIQSSPKFSFSLKFSPPNSTFCLVDSDFVRNCKFTVAESELIVDQSETEHGEPISYVFEDFGNFRKIIDDASLVLQVGLTRLGAKPENVLIVGKPGTGKSTLAKVIGERLSSSLGYIYSETISCKNIKGKSIDSLHRVFSSKIINLVYYQPSVLILDDLHVICEKVAEGDAITQESLHFNRVSEMMAILLENISNFHKIAILATSEAVLKLNRHIFSSRGQHLFKNVFSIDELGKNDRTLFLEFVFNKKCHLENANIEHFSLKTEGFVVQDLIDFADKAIFESLKEEFSENPKVTAEHCERSLQNTTALSLKDVQLHLPGDRDFEDIGGLDDVKKILVECMMWPVQYPNLFGNAPLRLQSGLLLYGPPGTGKTILAGAAAKHCGLRLISIKGPELLSKYIGASEEAVRNVFEKAQSAKPCILFFDEFDSLAPRRGHDSTGVTDRVVNQLLTQLDGIESLNGVCVLAATSRPDLLDPALLRPGRLDRQILCPLPNKESRLQILKALSKRMLFTADVDLLKIANETNGFSGADLQAILYTAQLSAVEHLWEDTKEKTDNVIEINQNHLEEALKNTRPSLTKEEKQKYKRIYSKFQQGSDLADLKSGLQKATLA